MPDKKNPMSLIERIFFSSRGLSEINMKITQGFNLEWQVTNSLLPTQLFCVHPLSTQYYSQIELCCQSLPLWMGIIGTF